MKTESPIHTVGYGLALFPLLVLTGVFAYALRVAWAVGHWPSYGNPEAWSFGFPLHYALLRPWFHVFSLAWFPVVSLIYTGAVWLLFRKFPARLFAVLALSSALLFTLIALDPGKLLDWFMD